MRHSAGWLMVVAGTAASVQAQTIFPERPEPNDLKAQSTVAAGMLPGDRLTGRTQGVGFGTGATSHDTFLVSPAALPPGVYRHQLTLVTAPVGGIMMSLRGLNQNNLRQIVLNTDVQIASGFVTSTVIANTWYGFGRQEPVYLRVQGLSASPQYTIEFSTQPAEVTPIASPFTTGQMSFLFESANASADAELWVYDSQFRPMIGMNNDDPMVAMSSIDRASLTRTLQPGTYYLIVGLANLANELVSPADEATPDDDEVLDVAGALAPRGGTTTSFFGDLTIMDSVDAFTIPNVPLSNTGRWYSFQVNSACTAPVIIAGPSSGSAAATQSFTFTAGAIGSEPMAWQWMYEGQDIAGATSSSYTIDSLNFAHAGSYSVRVSNACGQDTSASVLLSVVPFEPQIIEQPVSVAACPGATASFSVVATANMGGPLSYQWRRDGVMIPGAQNPVYECTAMEEGAYDCIVSEEGLGWAQSEPARMGFFRDPPRIRLNGPETVIVNRPVQTYEELGASAMDDCDPAVAVVIGGDVVNSSVPGQYVVSYDATDSQGLRAATVYRYVTVADAQRPAVSISVARPMIWPPNHTMQNVGLRVQAGDTCDGAVCGSKVKVRVFSDEPQADHRLDREIDSRMGAGALELRRERRAQGDGRVYLIVASVADASGNMGFASTTVVVPHDLSPASLARVRAQAASIQAKAAALFKAATTVRAVEDGLQAEGFRQVGARRSQE